MSNMPISQYKEPHNSVTLCCQPSQSCCIFITLQRYQISRQVL